MKSRDHPYISAVDDAIIIDDLVGLALLEPNAPTPHIAWANSAFSSLLGHSLGDLTGRRLEEIIDDPEIATAAAGRGERTARVATTGGAAVVVQLSPTGPGDRTLIAVRPVHTTARAALYDAVTGLASPALFREHLQLALNRRAREGDHLAVVAISAAKFGAAWQGQAEAASLLQTRMAEAIEQTVRDSDVLAARRPGALLLLVIDPTDAVAAATLASERLLSAFETPLVVTERLQRLNLHIGIGAALPDDGPEDVIARADTALAQAVREGSNIYRVALE